LRTIVAQNARKSFYGAVPFNTIPVTGTPPEVMFTGEPPAVALKLSVWL
jgi:hypothetical protein